MSSNPSVSMSSNPSVADIVSATSLGPLAFEDRLHTLGRFLLQLGYHVAVRIHRQSDFGVPEYLHDDAR